MQYILLIISAVLVNNVVLVQFLGICPFLGVSNKTETSIGMGVAVIFVMSLANLVTYLIQNYVLVPLHIEFMQTITFIFVIAFLVQVVEIILKKSAPALYQALGIYLPLITTNCAVLGIAILAVQKDFSLVMSVVYAASIATGFHPCHDPDGRDPRTTGPGKYPKRNERLSSFPCNSRIAVPGVYGVFGNC